MAISDLHPTPYPDVNRVLQMLCEGIQQILGEQLVGLYLHGSLAGGDFNPKRSDIDFLAVTEDVLPRETIDQLKAMHQRLYESGLAWATYMEGSYIPANALRRSDARHDRHPALRIDGSFEHDEHGSAWVIQRHIAREKGIALIGPPLSTLIDPVGQAELRQAQIGTLREWWLPMLSDASFIQTREYQAYAALTMCRALYTLEFGGTTTKSAAARWALETLTPAWKGLIESALAWPDGPQPDQLPETLALIDYTLSIAERAANDQY